MQQIFNRHTRLKTSTFSGLTSLRRSSGFTIVELLVVIVVIGILAAITMVSYSGITKKANEAAIVSDLATAKNQFALYYTEHSVYPTGLDANNCPTNATVTPNPDTNYCLKSGSGNTFAVTIATGSTYTLTATKNSTVYKVTNDSSPVAAVLTCPTGFIAVPGSSTYGTNDFCVMKYEAKIQGNDNGAQTYSSAFVPESRASGTPWVNISQTNAITEAQTACTSCHLITEAEWMTIAQNVLSVPSNWSTGTVGSGYIYSGHSDSSPTKSLAASTDSDGYYGTGQTAVSSQRRTLTLTNGEVIWDLAGNVWDWTSGTVQTPTIQPGVTSAGYAWREWTAVTNAGTLAINPSPAGTGLTNANTWNSSNGIGQIYSSSDEVGLRGCLRGGAWGGGSGAGVLSLSSYGGPGYTYTGVGFRVAASSGL